jgi:hypothetical protein
MRSLNLMGFILPEHEEDGEGDEGDEDDDDYSW